jgi:hypothetical protein
MGWSARWTRPKTSLVLVQQGRLLWNGTPSALEDDAAGTVWAVTLEPQAFESLRGRFSPT